MEQIKHDALVSLASQNRIAIASIIADQDGFHVAVESRKKSHVLIAKRGQVRVFANIDSAGKYLSKVGIPVFRVDMTNDPAKKKMRIRSDVSRKMKQMHQTYDEYILSEIQAGEKEKGKAVSHDEVMNELDGLINDIENKKKNS